MEIHRSPKDTQKVRSILLSTALKAFIIGGGGGGTPNALRGRYVPRIRPPFLNLFPFRCMSFSQMAKMFHYRASTFSVARQIFKFLSFRRPSFSKNSLRSSCYYIVTLYISTPEPCSASQTSIYGQRMRVKMNG